MQVVCVNNAKSDPAPLDCGVPQGSVGGPTLFSIYLTGLKEILHCHSFNYHCYADDIQIYTSFLPTQTNVVDIIQKLEACIHDIKKWMSSHSLKLNQEKSELLFIGSKVLLDKVSLPSLTVDNDVVIAPSKSCRNLGVLFDSTMSMSAQISAVCKSVRYQLRNLGIIRKYLTRSATEKK